MPVDCKQVKICILIEYATELLNVFNPEELTDVQWQAGLNVIRSRFGDFDGDLIDHEVRRLETVSIRFCNDTFAKVTEVDVNTKRYLHAFLQWFLNRNEIKNYDSTIDMTNLIEDGVKYVDVSLQSRTNKKAPSKKTVVSKKKKVKTTALKKQKMKRKSMSIVYDNDDSDEEYIPSDDDESTDRFTEVPSKSIDLNAHDKNISQLLRIDMKNKKSLAAGTSPSVFLNW